MSGQSITNLNPVPQNFNDAVTKRYVDNSISLAGGLSITGITMQGDINMDGHNVKGLVDPTNDDMAASKGYVESNFLDLAYGRRYRHGRIRDQEYAKNSNYGSFCGDEEMGV